MINGVEHGAAQCVAKGSNLNTDAGEEPCYGTALALNRHYKATLTSHRQNGAVSYVSFLRFKVREVYLRNVI